jgi:predicted nucleotidyltransferase
MPRPDATDAAARFVRTRFPECLAAFLGGSVVRGEATATSDLDIVVITNRPEAPFRESVVYEDWPVEVFVHTPDSIRHYFASDIERRAPTMPTLVTEGTILQNVSETADQIRMEAFMLLEEGPPPLTPEQIETHRYRLTDIVDDLEGSIHFDETIFIAAQAATAVTEFILAYQCQWSGSGKWTLRALRRYNAPLASELINALTNVYQHRDVTALCAFIDRALAGVGGRLFDGFRQSGRT